MFALLKRFYYQRLFLKIYFLYLCNGKDPENAINNAYEDIKAIRNVLHSL